MREIRKAILLNWRSGPSGKIPGQITQSVMLSEAKHLWLP
jgi:hypothetical protein